MEVALTEIAREIYRRIIERKDLPIIVSKLRSRQAEFLTKNPRWRAVEVKAYLRPDPYTSVIKIGNASIILEKVKGEWPPA